MDAPNGSGSSGSGPAAVATTRGIVLVLASSLVVAFVPNFAKLAYESGATPEAVVLLRYPVAVLLMAPLLLAIGGSLRPEPRILGASAIAAVFALMGGYGFMASVAYIDVSLAILIFYLHPVFIGIYGHVVGSHRLRGPQMAAAGVSLLGLGLALAVDLGRLDPRGLAFAFVGAIGATVMTLVNARNVFVVGSIKANFQMTLIAGLLMALLVPFLGPIELPQGGLGWLGLFGSATGITVTFVLFFAAVPILGTTRATLISIVEPIFGILVALALFGERLTLAQWLGVLLVVGGLFVIEIPADRLAALRRPIRRRG